MTQNKYTKLTYFILVISCCIYTFTFYPRYKNTATESTFGWDASGYHLYLPALFIDHDLKKLQNFTDSIYPRYQFSTEIDQYIHLPNGNKALRYPPGMAIMHSPAFFITHYFASFKSYPRDGWSKPYQIGLTISMFFYACIGLWFFSKLCLEFFSDPVTALLLAALVVGTNYLDYSFVNVALAHGLSFMWYSLLLYSTVKWYQGPKLKYAFLIGISIGLLCLIRILDLVAVLIPLGIGLFTKENRMLLSRHYTHLIIAAICTLCCISVLIFYYYSISGKFLVDTYQGFGFDWTRPHLYDYALSYRSGWLMYTPLMIIAIIGFIAWKHPLRLPLLLFLLLYYYFVSAWGIWWYGGRAMIGVYPILLLGLGFIFQNKLKFFSIPILLFIYFNIWYNYHLHYGQIQMVDNSRSHYWGTIGRWNHHPETVRLIDGHYLEKRKNLKFKTIITDSTTLLLSKENPISPRISFNIKEPISKIRTAVQVYGDTLETDVWRYSQLIVERYRNNQRIRHNMLRIQRFMKDGELADMTIDTPVTKGDSISIYLDNQYSDRAIRIQNWRIMSYE